MPKTSTGCQYADQIVLMENPMTTGMVAAVRHLEAVAATAGTPESDAARGLNPISVDRHRRDVLAQAARIREVLDRLTAPYEPAA